MARTVAAIEDRVRRALDAGDFERALETVQRTVEQLIYRPAFTARLFSSPALDRLCQAIGAAALARRAALPTAWSGAQVFIATHVYATGGHSAMLEDFVRAAGDGLRHVVLTGAVRHWDAKVAMRRFADSGCTVWHAPRGPLAAKLRWLIDWLAERAPERMFLFNHHQDAVAIAAAQPQLARQTVFYHHADHQLCLGVHLAHAVHVDPHPMGFHNCRTALGISGNIYCAITVPDLGPRPAAQGFPADARSLLSCTVGNRNKIEREYPYPYREIVPEFMRLTGGRHLHIGALSASTVAAVRAGLRSRGLPSERFEILESTRSVWREMIDRGVDAYLCSFPYGGVRAGVEAMGAGLPVIAHEHCASSFLGAADATYAGSLRWRVPDDLWRIARSLDGKTLAAHSRLARAHYETFHREDVLRDFLAGGNLGEHGRDAPPVREYSADVLQVCLSELGSARGAFLKPLVLRLGRSLERALLG